jgi:hypothetical protein
MRSLGHRSSFALKATRLLAAARPKEVQSDRASLNGSQPGRGAGFVESPFYAYSAAMRWSPSVHSQPVARTASVGISDCKAPRLESFVFCSSVVLESAPCSG